MNDEVVKSKGRSFEESSAEIDTGEFGILHQRKFICNQGSLVVINTQLLSS